MTANQYNTQTTAISGVVPQNYPDGQTLDNTVIGGTTPVAGSFTNLNVSGTFTNSGTSAGNTPVVTTASSLTLTAALHAGKTVVQNNVAGCSIALPAAAGTGNVYRIVVKVTITSVGVVVSATPLTDVFIGMAWVMSDNSQAVLAYLPAATDNTVTLNGTTTGGYLGHMLEFRDIASGIWEVQSFGKATGTEATPFSHV